MSGTQKKGFSAFLKPAAPPAVAPEPAPPVLWEITPGDAERGTGPGRRARPGTHPESEVGRTDKCAPTVPTASCRA